MRRIIILTLTAALTFALAVPANAAPPDAADLAADCNDDNQLVVSGSRNYVGGSGTITGECVVMMTPEATLNLLGIKLRGAGSFIVVDAQEDTTLRVLYSRIDLDGAVQLAPGCCAGGEPDRSEADALLQVVGSAIRGSSVELSASTGDTRGRTVVRWSVIEATGPLGLVVHASVSASEGRLTLAYSSLTSAGNLSVATGIDGATRARNNLFAVTGSTTITTGAGGACTASGNTPPVPCT